MTPDHSDIARIQKRMKEACRKMQEMATEVGMAETVIRYDKDRRKDTLARYVIKHLKNGESAAAAEQYARADTAYDAEMQGLLSQAQLAHTTLKLYEVEKCAWETARSLLSMQREILHTLPETEE